MASCARMYCLSNSLTLPQSRSSSSATSLMCYCGSAGPRNRQSASCTAGCRPETPAARASPCRNCGRPPAAPRTQGRCDKAARQISHPPGGAIVPTRVDSTAEATSSFFERLTSRTTRAYGSPNTPTTSGKGRNLGNRYESSRRLRLDRIGIGTSCLFRAPRQASQSQRRYPPSRGLTALNPPTLLPEDPDNELVNCEPQDGVSAYMPT